MALDTKTLPHLETAALALVREAGEIALAAFNPGARTSAAISWKDGGSPVTAADHAVDAFLAGQLMALMPDAAWHSEEQPALWRGDGALAFVIDPIDGTREFVEGRPGWCISLALVAAGVPVLGIVHAPALGETFHAHQGGGAFLNGAQLPMLAPCGPFTACGAKPAIGYLKERTGIDFAAAPYVPALAWRIARAAGGSHDLALARPGAHDWDIAAADCLLREVGGEIATLDGTRLSYPLDGREQPAFLAGGSKLLNKISDALLTKSG